jgi:hypothetical protein
MTPACAFLLAIFSPLRPVLQLWRGVMFFLQRLENTLADPGMRADLSDSAEGHGVFQTGIAFAEDGINFLIALRTREPLGLPLRLTGRRWQGPAPSRPRPFADLMKRYHRMRASLKTVERYARRRAAPILRLTDVSAASS